jgi:hypothetical protein
VVAISPERKIKIIGGRSKLVAKVGCWRKTNMCTKLSRLKSRRRSFYGYTNAGLVLVRAHRRRLHHHLQPTLDPTDRGITGWPWSPSANRGQPSPAGGPPPAPAPGARSITALASMFSCFGFLEAMDNAGTPSPTCSCCSGLRR